MTQIRDAVAQSVAFQTRNETGTTVLRGAYPWPLVPHVADDPDEQPSVDTPLASRILTPAPCGYFITEAEYTAPRMSSSNRPVDAGSVAQRLAIHGIEVVPAAGGVFVPLRQPYRGLIAPILDSQAVLPMLEGAERRYCFREDGSVGGTVPATLSLTLGAPASFGAFVPGAAREYTASTTANVISSAGDATLAVTDPSTVATGHLVNGTFVLEQPLQGLGSIKTYDAPVSNDVVTVEFKQAIGADEPLRTGSYSKTLTFTLSTTNP
jgi:hypothetical protein